MSSMSQFSTLRKPLPFLDELLVLPLKIVLFPIFIPFGSLI